MAPPTPKFSKGEVCVCVSKGTPYKSKVINITQKKGVECYIVHFDGWNSRYDVAVKVGSEDGELYKGTVEEYQAKMGGSTPKAATPKAKATPKAGARAKTPTPRAKTPTPVTAKTAGAAKTPKTPTAAPKTPVAPAKTPVASTSAAKKTPVAKVSKSTPISKKKTPAAQAKKAAPKKTEQSQESEESEAEDEEPMEVDESSEEAKFQAPEPPKKAQPAAQKAQTAQKVTQELSKLALVPRRDTLPTQAVPSEEIEVPIPQRLRRCLGDDYTIIGLGYEARLPVDATIDKILEDYISQVPGYDEKNEKWNEIVVSSKENINEAKLPKEVTVLAARSIQDYFNARIYSLFYVGERVQYRKLIISECKRLGVTDTDDLHRLHELGFRPSAHYGFVHLLRVFPVLPEYLAKQEWNDHMINLLLAGIKKFIKYLEENFDKYYKGREDYVAPDHSEKEAEECMEWLARSVAAVDADR
ncbi:unnamed protein product [Caenorhabditis nigoni]